VRGRYSPEIVSAEMRIHRALGVEPAVFVLTSLVFILIACSFPIVARLTDYTVAQLFFTGPSSPRWRSWCASPGLPGHLPAARLPYHARPAGAARRRASVHHELVRHARIVSLAAALACRSAGGRQSIPGARPHHLPHFVVIAVTLVIRACRSAAHPPPPVGKD